MRTVGLAMAIAMRVVGACAGRAPQPVAVVQPQDRFSDCTAITAEIGRKQRCVPAVPLRKHQSASVEPAAERARRKAAVFS